MPDGVISQKLLQRVEQILRGDSSFPLLELGFESVHANLSCLLWRENVPESLAFEVVDYRLHWCIWGREIKEHHLS